MCPCFQSAVSEEGRADRGHLQRRAHRGDEDPAPVPGEAQQTLPRLHVPGQPTAAPSELVPQID